MVPILRDTLKQKGISNVKIIQKDARDITEGELRIWNLEFRNYKVVANLPYYIATPIIRKFLEMENAPKTMVLTVQKEVAQRICAKPPRMNVLALSIQFYANPKVVSTIPNNAFWPKPEVDGAIIKITPHTQRPDREFSKQFFKVIKAGFIHPRKKLISNLEHALPTSKEKVLSAFRLERIPYTARAENVGLSGWTTITKTLWG
jgi:16S rRNA (adenine1518-N6/adenine1519-N6)-dimethyltransferase